MSIVVGSRTYNTYAITMPTLPQNPYNWSMTVNMPDGTYGFNFMWIPVDPDGGSNSGWYFSCTFPSGMVRQGRVSPNAVNWSQSPDIGIVWTTPLQVIGQNDLNGNCKMYMLYWLS